MYQLTCRHAALLQPRLEPGWRTELPAALKRRTPRIWQVAHVVMQRLYDKENVRPQSLITATALGALEETRLFLEGVYTRDFGSPKSFISSVHNSMGGKLAIDFRITGPNLTTCDGPHSFASALQCAALLSLQDFPVCIVVIDEKTALLEQLFSHLHPHCHSFLGPEWEESVMAFLFDAQPGGGTCFSAIGPVMHHGGEKTITCASLGQKLFPDETPTLVPPDALGPSPVTVAVEAFHRFSHNRTELPCVIGSYSPSAKSMAAVGMTQ